MKLKIFTDEPPKKAESIRSTLGRMKVGESVVIPAGPPRRRNGLYVMAKGVGIDITTAELADGSIQVWCVQRDGKPTAETVPALKETIKVIEEQDHWKRTLDPKTKKICEVNQRTGEIR